MNEEPRVEPDALGATDLEEAHPDVPDAGSARRGTARRTDRGVGGRREAATATERRVPAGPRCTAEHRLENAEAFGSDAIASGIYLRPNGIALPVLMLPRRQAAEVPRGARPFNEAADAVRAAREGAEVCVRLARRRSTSSAPNPAWVEQEEAVLDSPV